jgi:hypothetical protein
VATVNGELTGTWLVAESSGQDLTVQYSGDVTVLLKPVEGDEDTKEPDRLSLQATQSTVTTPEQVLRQSLQMAGLTFVVKRKDTACRVGESQ